ncbi:MAG TPA: glutaredoxin domain-containing protein [Anaerolineae bacterium]|nr:glutaredoxin domain-containing protein [Anaerolineae bacterium]
MKVTVYTTPTCGYCYQAKQFLNRQGVSFVEKNVAADRKAAMEMVRVSGQQGVPVITVDGQVVVGFDQPRLMELLKNSRPKLGASVADAARQAKKRPGIPDSGAYVGQVRSGSPAERAGLRQGDVVTALGGQPVVIADDLHKLVADMPKGRELSLTFVRNGKQKESLIRL